MRIGIEAQRIFRSKKHGMDFVALELIRNLIAIDQVNEYFIFVNEDEDKEILREAPNCKIVFLPKSLYPVWEQKHLAAAIKIYKLDLLHCTSNTAPIACSVPLFLTLHDIIYMEKLHILEGSLYQRFGNLYRRWNVPRVVKRASCIFTVSRFEEQRILKQFDLDRSKILVTYNGIGDHFRKMDLGEAEDIRKQYDLPERYALFLGNTDPKKNLNGVVRAMWQVYQQGKMDYQLVMPDFGREELMKILKSFSGEALMDKIHLTGYVSNKDLPGIYNQALFFLYPSLRESFGIPILEAMACHCPVITSNTSSMPEVAGDAALMVDPHNYQEIADAAVRIVEDTKLRYELIHKGADRYPSFSYRQSAYIVLDAYKRYAH